MDEKILHTERIYDGALVQLDLLQVELPDGSTGKREIIRHPGAVAVIARDGDDVLLVRQYRSAAQQIMLELPAGTLEPDEPPEECATRELQEETGYKPGTLTPMGGFYNAAGYTTEYIHLYVATDLTPSALDGDADEFLELVRLPLARALTMIEHGDIQDAKTIIGLLRVAKRA